MKRSMLLGCLAAAALTSGLVASANAAPVSAATAAVHADTAATQATQVHYRGGRGYYHRPGFSLYLGAPAYVASRCWWSHRLHRRVCNYY